MWKATKEVGFGKAVKQGKCVIVAHYRPAGNVDGKFVRNVAPAKAGAKMPLPPKNTASKSVKGMSFVLINHGKIVKMYFLILIVLINPSQILNYALKLPFVFILNSKVDFQRRSIFFS